MLPTAFGEALTLTVRDGHPVQLSGRELHDMTPAELAKHYKVCLVLGSLDLVVNLHGIQLPACRAGRLAVAAARPAALSGQLLAARELGSIAGTSGYHLGYEARLACGCC